MTGCGDFWTWGVFVADRRLRLEDGRVSREGAAIGFGCVMQVGGTRTDGVIARHAALDMDALSLPTLVGEAGIARDRPQGGPSWGPPLPPNDRRGRSFANKQILGRAGTTVLEGPA